jgi:hypothetical protein
MTLHSHSDVPCVAALIGRADLSDEELRHAIAERLAADGRTSPDPDIVLEAARARKRKAVAFLRTLVLPQPRAELTMPIQPILRSHLENGG